MNTPYILDGMGSLAADDVPQDALWCFDQNEADQFARNLFRAEFAKLLAGSVGITRKNPYLPDGRDIRTEITAWRFNWLQSLILPPDEFGGRYRASYQGFIRVTDQQYPVGIASIIGLPKPAVWITDPKVADALGIDAVDVRQIKETVW